MYEELLHTSRYNLVLLQETKWVHDSEYKTPKWICVGSGDPKQKHAGVMVMIRRRITVAEEVKYECDLAGRIIRVRFPIGNNFVNVICAYQHAWNNKDKAVLDKRAAFWKKLDHCVRKIPNRELLLLGGDFNVQVNPSPPFIGHGTGRLSKDRAPDAYDFSQLLETHDLTALNTWGKSGEEANTFVFGEHRAQLDFIIARRRDAMNSSRKACPLKECPVGGWRRSGGYHLPVVAALRACIPRSSRTCHCTPKVDENASLSVRSTPTVPTMKCSSPRCETGSRPPLQGSMGLRTSLQLVAEIDGDVFSRNELSPKYQNPVSLVPGITNMGRQWMRIKRLPAARNLREMISRWKIWSAYCKNQKSS